MCDGYAMFKALFTFVQNHLLRVVVFFLISSYFMRLLCDHGIYI
jgi:hypothetical protein